MSPQTLRASVAALVIALTTTLPAVAQEQTGSIEGVVRDQQGGLLRGVTVNARNLVVDVTLQTLTDERGAFRFAALGPGFYDVTASLDGFEPSPVRFVGASPGSSWRTNRC